MTSSPLDNHSVVRDPIHGFVEYNLVEEEILNSSPLQRLRNVKQLGPASLVYPGAEHTRFQHSIGVMHVASRIYNLIVPKWKDQLRWTPDDVIRNRSLLRLAALLHDVGHGPFSHTSEELFPEGYTHVRYSYEIVKASPIREILDHYAGVLGFDSTSVADLISGEFTDPKAGKAAFLREILSGDLDADRMDYLLRDSHYCGVQYGKYDMERLLHSLTLRENKEAGNLVLAVKESGLHAAEGLIMARYFMFTQVYYHSVNRCYEHHIVDFIRNAALGGGRFPPELDSFLAWDDGRIVELFKERAKVGDADAKRIMRRNHFREVATTKTTIDSTEEVWWRTMLAKFHEKFAGAHQFVDHFVDESEKAPHKFREADFHVILDNNRSASIIEQSDLVANLKAIFKMRLYVSPERETEVRTFCNQPREEFGPRR